MNDLHMNPGRLTLFLFLLYSFSISLQAQDYAHARIKVQPEAVIELAALGLALDHVHWGEGFVEGDFSYFGLEQARIAGYEIKIIHADAEAAYLEQKPVSTHSFGRNNAACVAGLTDFDYTRPTHYQPGTYQGNFRYQEMLDELDRMASLYPHLITRRQEITGYQTHEGRPIYWLKISDRPDQDEDEPEILYTALHHAREPVSLTQMIYFMWYLLDRYDSDAKIRYLLDNTEMYFIPCVNPDGYLYNEEVRPEGGGLWRKNRRNNGDGTFGVDLNRNYGHQWGINNEGSSGSSNSDVYRGPAPFSEPETQAIRHFVMQHEFALALNYHTYGDFLIYPYGYTSRPAEDIEVYEELGTLLTRENRFIHGTGLETVRYPTNGDSDDWMYGGEEKHRVFSMTPEVGSSAHGFWPNPEDVEFLCQSTLKQNIDAAYFLLNSGMLQDESETFITEKQGYLPLRLTKLGFDEVGMTLQLTPITSNITFTGAFKFYILGIFASQREEFAYILSENIQDGERIRFAYTIDNGTYQQTDTIVKYYREDRLVFENAGVLDDWMHEGMAVQWGATTSEFFSAPSSLTDSPNGNTIPYSTNILTSEDIYLETADSAVLTFQTRFDIQNDFDYLQLELSAEGGSYEPLCGRYSTAGRLAQNLNEPVYTGKQLNWVIERIDLTPYIGQSIRLRFTMVSSNNSTRDGGYIDDLKVLVYDQGSLTSHHEIDPAAFTSSLYPNPARSQVNLETTLSQHDLRFRQVRVINALGQEMVRIPYEASVAIQVDHWPAGLYLVQLLDEAGRQTQAMKLKVE